MLDSPRHSNLYDLYYNLFEVTIRNRRKDIGISIAAKFPSQWMILIMHKCWFSNNINPTIYRSTTKTNQP